MTDLDIPRQEDNLTDELVRDNHKLPTWAAVDKEIAAVEWVWPSWLPRGMVTELVGGPGVGKSNLALAMVKAVTVGCPWPDGTLPLAKGKVVWVETEEAQQVNLERAKAWGVPLEKVIVPSTRGLFADPRLDRKDAWADLERAAHHPGVELVNVDSLRGAFRGDENSSQIAELFTKLTSLARDAEVAILVNHHLRKKSILDSRERITLDRVRGSSAIVATPRVIWAIDRPDPAGESWVRLYQIKNNLARFPEELGFQITDTGLVYASAPQPPKRVPRTRAAEEFLCTLLVDGPMLSAAVMSEAEDTGISRSTLNRAKGNLGITSSKIDHRWWWGLPDGDEVNGT